MASVGGQLNKATAPFRALLTQQSFPGEACEPVSWPNGLSRVILMPCIAGLTVRRIEERPQIKSLLWTAQPSGANAHNPYHEHV